LAEQQVPTQAPDFTLDHVLGHSVSLADFRGRTVVVMFGGRDSAEQIKRAAETIRGSHDPEELPIVSVSDLEAVPRPARIIAKSQLKKAFEEAVRDQRTQLESAGRTVPEDPAKSVVMLMDWNGEVAPSFGMSGVDQQAAGVVVDGDGQIVGSGSGDQLGEELMAALPAR
jgi:AhpC/TSA family